ncbi:uncharacterized protein LOC134844435 [Symsagittifera roscoffensis]|uniref:uncharacterized protein LOC134844435 n=1 Tax=Symsagittifera roscoffensis TaxID=84072 RepID=UPI00307CBC5E
MIKQKKKGLTDSSYAGVSVSGLGSSGDDWYLSGMNGDRSASSVVYLPEIKEGILKKRVTHQRQVADWARSESKKLKFGSPIGSSKSSHTNSTSLEEEASYRQQLKEKQLQLSYLKYRKLRQKLVESALEKPSMISDIPNLTKSLLGEKYLLEDNIPRHQRLMMGASYDYTNLFDDITPRSVQFLKKYPLLGEAYMPSPRYYPHSPAHLQLQSLPNYNNYPFLHSPALHLSHAGPLVNSPDPLTANQMLMQSLLSERALHSLQKRLPPRARVDEQMRQQYHQSQTHRPFMVPPFSL